MALLSLNKKDLSKIALSLIYYSSPKVYSILLVLYWKPPNFQYFETFPSWEKNSFHAVSSSNLNLLNHHMLVGQSQVAS